MLALQDIFLVMPDNLYEAMFLMLFLGVSFTF